MSLFEKIFSAMRLNQKEPDEEARRIIASYLRIFLIVSIGLLPLYVIIKILGEGFLPSSFINFALALFCVFFLYLLNKGKVVLSGTLFLLTAWLAMTIMSLYADGVQDMAIVAYILIIFLATLFSGIRFAVIIALMSIISVWVLAILQNHGIIIYKGDIPLNYSRDYTITIAMVLTAIILLSRSFRNSLERVNRELKERIKVEERLFRNEQSLIEKNEELIIAKEKAEESDRLKTAFIQNISHEIRTPMNGIVGFLDLLQQPAVGAEKREEYIEIINSCTIQLATLVNDLIDISKIETGAIDLHISEFEVDQLLNDVSVTHTKSAINKNLVLKVINDIGNVSIKTDHEKVRQILNNLVSNAIKFTEKGSITIKVSENAGNLLMSVTDTGIGISESDKMIIFDRFRQAEIGLSRSFGGSGLGLAITKGYVEFLEGKIWVDSKPDIGSVFTVSIPVEFISGKISSPRVIPGLQLSQNLKILVAEDDEINYLYIKELLSFSSVNIVWARNGSEAVELFKSDSGFDLVLMDLKMPVLNGYDATKKIRSVNPDIPVIAVTAFSFKEDIERATLANFSAYVVKPVDKNELILKINSVLKL